MANIPGTETQNLVEWAGGRERSILAITFTDIVGSTSLTRQLGDQAMRKVLGAHFRQSSRLIATKGGRWIKSLGDGDLAVFGNVEAALAYAVALQTNPGHTVLDSRIRAGIHVGVVDLLLNDIRGNAVNFASRVSSTTKAAEIWLSAQAMGQLVDLNAEEHSNLRWQDHPGVALNGFEGEYTLWSLAPAGSGRMLADLAAGPLPSARGQSQRRPWVDRVGAALTRESQKAVEPEAPILAGEALVAEQRHLALLFNGGQLTSQGGKLVLLPTGDGKSCFLLVRHPYRGLRMKRDDVQSAASTAAMDRKTLPNAVQSAMIERIMRMPEKLRRRMRAPEPGPFWAMSPGGEPVLVMTSAGEWESGCLYLVDDV